MSINVSSLSGTSLAAYTRIAPPSTQAKSDSGPREDTVHLSNAALAAAGDADHDGDSH